MRNIFEHKNKLASSLFKEWDADVTLMSRKILIIDDELDICLLLSGYLKKAGYDAVYTTTIQSGIELAKQIKPFTIFLDHNLPDGLGIPYINKFKELQSEVYIISALSNLKDEAF